MKELDIERGNKGGRMRRGHKRERGSKWKYFWHVTKLCKLN